MDKQAFNWHIRNIFRGTLRFIYEIYCKVFNKAFSCGVLNGQATYHLAVNSDMTVSCNCQDFNGEGQIGDLTKNSLLEIFSGKKAMQFRKVLAGGRLPILDCVRCTELKLVKPEQAEELSENWDIPRNNIMIENTILCKCSCVSCPRPEVMKRRKKLYLTLNDIHKVAKEIKANSFKKIAYFNLGDPFVSKNIYEEIKILKKENPQIQIYTSTNGLSLDCKSKFEAALLLDKIEFSIDGINTEMVQKYQRNGNFNTSYNNLCQLARLKNEKGLKNPSVEWKYVVFNWNDKPEYINEAIDLARKSGADFITFWPTFTPFWGTSWRWYTKFKFFRGLGKFNGGFVKVALK
jgi:hypothetical protein